MGAMEGLVAEGSEKTWPLSSAIAFGAEIYNQFTKGFDTPDLKDAKALLDALNGTDAGRRS